jgi:AcrR family transcriptional regulator
VTRGQRTQPRKLPKQERAKATVDALLDAAKRVLISDGYERATTNRIAEVANVNIASLYQYFPSKDALVAALIDQHLEAISIRLATSMRDVVSAPLADAVHAIVGSHLELHRGDLALQKVLLEQVPRVERVNPVMAFRRRVIDATHALFSSRADEIKPHDPELAAFVVVHIIDGLTQAVLLERPEYLSRNDLESEIASVVLRYLAA